MTATMNLKKVLMALATLCLISIFALSASAASKEQQLLNAINKERTKAGLTAVTMSNSTLNSAAKTRAQELTSNYSYLRPNGKREFTVLSDYNISDISVGEAYLAGTDDASTVVSTWMNNEYFRNRILDKDATTVGIAFVQGGQYGYYWTAIFTYAQNTSENNFAQEVLNLVNEQRAANGLAALSMGSESMNIAAQKRAEEIATVASHTRPNGTSCFTVFDECNSMDTATGENAAWGETTPEEVVNDWMNSPEHRANILDPDATKMSVGYYYNSNSQYGHQWIQLFAK